MLVSPSQELSFRVVEHVGSESVKSFFNVSAFRSVHLAVPNAIKLSNTLQQIMSSDENQYILVKELPLTALVEQEFVYNFVRTGSLWLFTEGENESFDNHVLIKPPGELILSVTTKTYRKLSLHGKLCTAKKLNDNRYELTIDLGSLLCKPGKKDYDRICARLQQNKMHFTVVLKWIPSVPATSDGTILDYLLSRGLDCRTCEPETSTSVNWECPLPKLDYLKPFENTLDACSAEDILQWMGASICGIKWRDDDAECSSNVVFPHPAQISRVLNVDWEGMFIPDVLEKLFNDVRKIPKEGSTVPYVVILAHRFHKNRGTDQLDGYTFNRNKLVCLVVFHEGKSWLLES